MWIEGMVSMSALSFFWMRSKQLKSVNILDLIPVTMVDHEVAVGGKVNLIIPRFNYKFLKKIFTGARISEAFRLLLDETGSHVWLCINGVNTVGAISNEMTEHYREKNIEFDNSEERISKFIEQLYNEGCISFRNLRNRE
jgi:hypothetical protein